MEDNTLSTLLTVLLQKRGGYSNKVLNIKGSNLIAYWPLNDAAGSSTVLDASGNGRNGAVNADITLGVAGISGTAGVRNGSTVSEGINIYSTSLRSAFNPNEITISAWIKASSTIWAFSGAKTLFQLRADINNRVSLAKTGTIPSLGFSYIAGGTTKTVTYTTTSPSDWVHLAMTISKTNDEVKAYLNGSQVGTTLTGLGTWVGNIVNGVCNLFGYSSGGYWEPDGYLSHVAVWNTALSASEVADLADPFDSSSPTFFAIGDSKTANNPNWVDYLTASYPQIVARPLRYAGGGWTTQMVKDGIDSALASRSDTPNYALINLGANDVSSGDPGITWKTNTAFIANAMKTKWPNIQVYLTKVWRRNTGLQAVGIAAVNGYIDELINDPYYSAWLHVGINEANILEGGDDGVTYTSDGIHPTAVGCALEASAWRFALNL